MSDVKKAVAGMCSRERVLAAIDGEPTDRVPVYFDLEPFAEQLRQMGIDDPDIHFGVDLKKIWFVPAAEQWPEEEDGPHIGNKQQRANYSLWRYYPGEIDRRNPLFGEASVADVEAYNFPVVEGAQEVSQLRESIARHHERGFAVAGQIPHLGGVVFETAYRLRGLDNLLEDFRLRPAFADALLDHVTDAACRNVAKLASGGVDIVLLGDDIGTPTSMLISPQMWRRWIKPRLARMIEAARRARPQVAIAYHSDGYFQPVVRDLVEIGVNILNPVQPDCMEPRAIREEFAGELALWGTVGSASLMPFGSPAEIEGEVRERMETLEGRLVLGPAYDLEGNVPIENVLAFFRGAGTQA
ncbi:MAG: uroporphyrinogen decarboxylase family protein [Planctomycetia bacterium]|nr:uroporphyrinogen decarboxylase family protein [Planctomycetia bacterium]